MSDAEIELMGRRRMGAQVTRHLATITARDAEIARLRKALKWYANAKRYQYTGWRGAMDRPAVLSDAGACARAALKEAA